MARGLRKAGDRVYMILENEKTGEEVKVWGTVTHDEIEFHDQTSVKFDEFPAPSMLGNWPGKDQVIPSYFLFDEEDADV